MNRAKLVCVRRLFSGASRYHCSAFGRGFVWGPAELAQLLIDLEDGSRLPAEKGSHRERMYLGVVTLGGGSHGASLMLDGQQRLAALAMLLAFARDRTQDPRERLRLETMLFRQRFRSPPQARIRLLDDEHPWFAARILSRDATLRLPQDAPPGGARNLLACARFLSRAFAAYSAADRRRLTDFIVNNTAVVLSHAQEHSLFHGVHVIQRRPEQDSSAPVYARPPAA